MDAFNTQSMFEKVIDRESLYSQGTYILALDDENLSEQQRDFKHCYNVALALGNGFSGVFSGDSYIESLPRAVSAFQRSKARYLAHAGMKVLNAFSEQGILITQDRIVDSYYETGAYELLVPILRVIDDEYIEKIWNEEWDVLEFFLIELASSEQH
jgi:hypothetical protein